MVGHGWGPPRLLSISPSAGAQGLQEWCLPRRGRLYETRLDPSKVEEAEVLVAAGRGWQLLPWGTRPGMAPNTVSAQSYAKRPRVHGELYGGNGQPPALAKVDVPVLTWFGDCEGRGEGDIDGFFERIRRDALAAPQVHTKVLSGGSFLYTGIEEQVARHLVSWERLLNKSHIAKTRAL